jgi:hypothetical protein
MRADRFELPLRIVVQDPLPALTLTLLRGASDKATPVPPAVSSPNALAFDFDVTVDGALADGRPRFLGPYVQGPPAERFVYVRVVQGGGGQIGRMKVPLGDLSWALIETRAGGSRIEGRVPGRNPRGGPALATVRVLAPGWTHASG